ncbi:hypothetical protein C2G38_2037897 [Gigaspora rosea]|uniref:Uncharacterized protein n=1 Tax=Gigaspora rosea TaxID=44941 RepID=A0A397V441_9GLOM|nr:hypothetical protein C2G38_2037897 [Gigaspora rosea]
MVNIMNDTAYPVEQKSKGFVPFVPKYIFLTARKAPNEAYNFSKRHDKEDSTQHNWGQFQRCLDYIIEFRGDEQKFRSMIWNIKYQNGENNVDKIIEKSKKINQNQGIHTVIGNIVYWKKDFPEFKKRYLQNYPKSKNYLSIDKKY